MRIVHLISEFSVHEAMGRTIAETVRRLPGEHFLVTTRVHDGADRFVAVHEVGGSITGFPFQRHAALAAALDEISPDLVHLHGGGLTPLWAQVPALRRRPAIQTIYGWPRIPKAAHVRAVGWSAARSSNVLRGRVLLTTLLPGWLARAAVRHSRTTAVLTPDPDAAARLEGSRVDVLALPSGASPDRRRARFGGAHPVILFAGRAEAARGILPLLQAFPLIRAEHPGARLKLLLLPTPELPAIERLVREHRHADAIDLSTTPCTDLTDELAAAQIGVWPFVFDYTTSPPAMALVEAMAVGLPVVSTPVTCVRSVAVDDVNACLVPVLDHRRLAEAITGILADAARWQRLSAGGLATVAGQASWDAAASVTAAAYGVEVLPEALVTA